MRKLLSMALNPGTSDVLYEHVAGVLCNITQQRVGRELLVESSMHGLRAVVDMLVSSSDIKRTGAAAAIKNVVRCRPLDACVLGCCLPGSSSPKHACQVCEA